MPMETTFDLSPADVAEKLGTHEDTIKRWAKAGKIRALKTPGGWWRFSQADVDAFIAANSQHGEPLANASTDAKAVGE